MSASQEGQFWGETFLRVAEEVSGGIPDDVLVGSDEDVEGTAERYRELAMAAKDWRIQQVERLLLPAPTYDLMWFGVRMICYGILVGSASNSSDADESITALFDKMTKMVDSFYCEEEIAPAVPAQESEAKTDRAIFQDHVIRLLIDEEFEEVGTIMSWGADLAALGMIVGNRIGHKGDEQ